MNKLLLYKYLDKLEINDIKEFSIKQNINLTTDELSLIYHYLKEYPDKLLNNPQQVLLEIKDKLNINTYNKILELYDKYKMS